MTNVILTAAHAEHFTVLRDVGVYVDGIWTPSEVQIPDVVGSIFPVAGNDIRNYPEGTLTLKDYKLYTNIAIVKDKNEKGTRVIRDNTGESFTVITYRDYLPSSDLRICFLRATER